MSERTLLGVLRTPPEYWGDQSAIDHTERYIRCVEAANHIEHQSRELDALRARVATLERDADMLDRGELIPAEIAARLTNYATTVGQLRARVARDSEAYTRMETRAIDAEARVAELEALLTEALCWVPRGGLPGKFKEKAEKRLSGNKDSQ